MASKDKSLNILVIRFSSIGDVAMTVPVLDSFARQYPQHRVADNGDKLGLLHVHVKSAF